MDTVPRFILPAVVYLLTLASGFWLSSAGKPYHTAIFNLHKLIALGAVVLAAIQVAVVLRNVEAQASLILLVVLAGISVLALFATGALMSIGKQKYTLLRAVHATAPVSLALSVGAFVWLLAG